MTPETERIHVALLSLDPVSTQTCVAAARIIREQSEQLRAVQRTLWLIVNSNGGYTIKRADLENYPGDSAVTIEQETDAEGNVALRAGRR